MLCFVIGVAATAEGGGRETPAPPRLWGEGKEAGCRRLSALCPRGRERHEAPGEWAFPYLSNAISSPLNPLDVTRAEQTVRPDHQNDDQHIEGRDLIEIAPMQILPVDILR